MSDMPETVHTLCMVDDDETEFAFLEEALVHVGARVRLVKLTDPLTAARSIAQTRPSLVLLDLNMPGRSGHEVLADLKDNPETRTIPVIIFSSSESTEDFERSYRHHANAYIVKPSSLDGYRFLARSLEDFWFKIASVAV